MNPLRAVCVSLVQDRASVRLLLPCIPLPFVDDDARGERGDGSATPAHACIPAWEGCRTAGCASGGGRFSTFYECVVMSR
jgi:hypothetical protein